MPGAFNSAGALAFEPLKSSILRVGAVIIGVAWAASRLRQPPGTDVGGNPVVRAGLVLIGLAGLSTLLSIEPLLSLWGGFDRGMGWLSLAAGGVLLLSAADLFVDEHRRERAITALLLGSLVPCGYLLVQRAGLDPVTWTTLGASGSSLGSPTFLGGYLVIVAPFAAYRAVKSAARSGRQTELGRDAVRVTRFSVELLGYAGWLAVLLVVCSVTFLTTIRGPILGLAAATVTFAVLARPRVRPSRLEIGGALGVLLVGLGLAVAATGGSGLSGLQRFATIARGSDSSVERLTVWRDSALIPLAEPLRVLVGYGPETQAAVLERGEATVRLTQNQQWDRAHNLFLDTWLTGGVLGVGALLVVLYCAGRSAWRARASGGSLLSAAVLAALVGHVVEASFAFETVVTGALFWLIVGLAAALEPPGNARRLGAVLRHGAGSKVGGAVVVVGALIAPLLATPAVADALYGAARRANYEVGAQQEELASQLAPWVEELPRAAALDWQQVANRRGDELSKGRVEVDLREAAARAPREPVPELRLVRLYLNQNDLDAAEQACQRALANGPYRAAIWDACADVSARRGLTDEAHTRRARGEDLRQPT